MRQMLLYREMYHNQGRVAARRNIDFELSFEDWLLIWVLSRKLHLRGSKRGQYVMARRGDKGPYAVGNVSIIPVEDNHREAWASKTDEGKAKFKYSGRNRIPWNKGQRHTLETRAKMSAAHLGRKCPFNSQRAKVLGHANKGRKHTRTAKKNMAAGQRGRTHSAETKLKMSEARRLYWARKR